MSARKFTDEKLAEAALNAQMNTPMLSEGGVMGEIGVGREYLSDRAKNSPMLQEIRSKMAAIREAAWIKSGIAGLPMGKDFNAILFIWMTRNILGWRDRTPEEAKAEKELWPLSVTPEILRDLVKTVRNEK